MPSSDSLSLRLRLCALTLLRRITRRLIKQKAHDQAFPCGHSPFVACRCTVSGSISLPSPGFFSPFPHGTGSLSVAGEYLALEGGPPRFLRGFTCPVVLGYAHQRDQCDSVYRAITCYGGTFQSLRLSPDLVTLRVSPVSAPQPQNRLLGSGLGWSPFARRY